MSSSDIREISQYFPSEIRGAINMLDIKSVKEIHIKPAYPITVYTDRICFLTDNGLSDNKYDGIKADTTMLAKTLERMCQNSMYAMKNQLINGFIILKGGHRAGICGKTVIDGDKITHLSEISSLNLRISHQIKGSADTVMDKITYPDLSNTIIISPPACGKTTLLRDIARQLAGEKYMYRVGIVDERGEIAACHNGQPQNDIGLLSDVYHLCPKPEGMMMLLRGMSPQVVVTDEIGSEKDARAIYSLSDAGIRIICTAHAFDKEDLLKRKEIAPLINDNVIKRIIVLSKRCGVGTIEKIY